MSVAPPLLLWLLKAQPDVTHKSRAYPAEVGASAWQYCGAAVQALCNAGQQKVYHTKMCACSASSAAPLQRLPSALTYATQAGVS